METSLIGEIHSELNNLLRILPAKLFYNVSFSQHSISLQGFKDKHTEILIAEAGFIKDDKESDNNDIYYRGVDNRYRICLTD